MYPLLATTILSAILTLPMLPAAWICAALGPAGAPLAVLVYAVLYGLLAGGLSRPFHGAIQAGKFDCDLATPLYRGRRLYGLCWTAVYYCPPILHLFLAVPFLKRTLCTLFGCPALADATFYPDTWLRDLPLLELGEGAYLANRATIGTNTVLAGGRIVVGRIQVGRHAVVGHLAAIGQGARLGDESELGFRASLGMRSSVGARSKVGAATAIGFGSRIGDDVTFGFNCFVGSRVTIADGLEFPSDTTVPDRTTLRTQADVDRLVAGTASRPTIRPLAIAG